jgi:hypothetical protein
MQYIEDHKGEEKLHEPVLLARSCFSGHAPRENSVKSRIDRFNKRHRCFMVGGGRSCNLKSRCDITNVFI